MPPTPPSSRRAPDGFGLSCALATPFGPDGSLDLPRLIDHAGWCLAEGCASVTVFGTTGEGASIGVQDRERALAALAAAGLDLRGVIGGVAASSVEEAVRQMGVFLDAGCRAVLVAPPFYFKGVPDEGLFAWFAGVFEGLGGRARGVILYNIPPVTQVPIPIGLLERLRAAYPGLVVGVKDSSGDWPYTQRLLAARGEVEVLVGDERHLAPALGLGASGAISGLANVVPQALARLIAEARADTRIDTLVEEVLRWPVTPAVKALMAHRTGDPAWLTVRPPLASLAPAEAAGLGAAFDRIFAAEPA